MKTKEKRELVNQIALNLYNSFYRSIKDFGHNMEYLQDSFKKWQWEILLNLESPEKLVSFSKDQWEENKEKFLKICKFSIGNRYFPGEDLNKIQIFKNS